jgi:hypothetical protein
LQSGSLRILLRRQAIARGLLQYYNTYDCSYHAIDHAKQDEAEFTGDASLHKLRVRGLYVAEKHGRQSDILDLVER